jgi:hypothetical protein
MERYGASLHFVRIPYARPDIRSGLHKVPGDVDRFRHFGGGSARSIRTKGAAQHTSEQTFTGQSVKYRLFTGR